MSRLAPKYILLSTSTQKYSTSTNEHSIHGQSFEAPTLSKAQTLPHLPKDRIDQSKQNSLYKDFALIKEELNQTIQIMAIEQKRNTTLKSLNQMLESANREADQKEKRIFKPKMDKEKRKLSKEEYQIDQLLQKYNQEVAKIAGLREQVNSARTDRVVFSALFKKIEREIKHYENLYREKITNTEMGRITKQAKIPANRSTEGSLVDQIQLKEESTKNNSLFHTVQRTTPSRLFMTNPEKALLRSTLLNKTSDNQDYSTLISGKIEEVESKINLIVNHAQCSSPEEACSLYNSLQKQNNKLMHMIEEEQWNIEDIEEEMERIRLERRNSECTEEKHMKKLTSMHSMRKLRSLRHIKNNSVASEIEPKPTQIIEQLLQIAGLQNNISYSMVDVMSDLQEILLGEENQRGRMPSTSGPGLENLLTKMEKFDNCQRIFSKRQFQGQYLKEMAKQRRQLKSRK